MKKIIVLGICVLATVFLAGCGGGGTANRQTGNQTGVDDVLKQQMEKADAEAAAADAVEKGTEDVASANVPADVAANDTAAADADASEEVSDAAAEVMDLPASERQNGVTNGAPEPQNLDPEVLSNTEGIDIDLTILSSTMVYGEVYSMMTTPEEFLGKTVKMKGAFSYYKDAVTENEYFACVVQDAAACCAQGLEFILEGDYSYPEDYPELGTEITVVGSFDTYQEGEYTYVTMRNAHIV